MIENFSVLKNQLEECLQSFEREREEKISLRRELADLAEREHLPRTPSRGHNRSIDAASVPCPSSPESGSEVSILQAQSLKDRIRKYSPNTRKTNLSTKYLTTL